MTIDQFVVGLTLNIFVLGLALFLDSRWEAVTSIVKPTRIPLLVDIPLVGDGLFGQPWPMYLIVPLVPVAWWLVFRTRWGLEVRSVGDSPQAADVSGIHVNRRRREAIMFAGVCAGLGGGVLVLGQISISGYEEGHVGLKGIIAIAAVIFGGWTLRGTLAGCLVFGYFFAMQQTLPVLGHHMNPQLAASLPYVVALNTFDGNYWDRYEGYDLDRDGVGDVPFRPVSLYAVVQERMPYALMLMRSFMVYLLDKAEKIIPSLTPEQLMDEKPAMQPIALGPG